MVMLLLYNRHYSYFNYSYYNYSYYSITVVLEVFCMDIADQQTCKTAIRQIQETTRPTA